MMVEILCGILSGGLYGPTINEHKTTFDPMNLSHCFIAINPECFAPGFAERMQDLMDSCRSQVPASGQSSVMVAGDPEREHMKLCDSLGGIPYHVNQIKFAKHTMNYILIVCLLGVSVGQLWADTCTMSTSQRQDCGDVSTTATSCTAKGCCWQVTTEAGRPNCFYMIADSTPATTSAPPPAPTPASSGKKVFIHMMPWFETKASNNGQWGQHWTMANMNPDIIQSNGERQIASHYYPLIDLYASGDPDVIDWQLGLMRLSGVTGVIIDWPGSYNALDYARNRQNAEAIIAGTQRNGLQFAIDYEDHNLALANVADTVGQATQDMEYLQNNYFSKANYVRINGAPLLLDFGPQTLEGSQWDQAFTPLNPKPLFLPLWYQIGDCGTSGKGEYPWIYSDFMSGLQNFYSNHPLPFKMGVAYPGFNTDYAAGGWGGPTWTIPVGTDTFSQTLSLALANADYIQVATWNDYGEGTMVEPTRDFGYSFLTILQQQLGSKHTQADLEQLTTIYNSKKANQGNQAQLALLETQRLALINS
ncbi:unnamed protein product [Oppiella nova]|uniref:P-type domain-containing protein n=1 Tax=Oppiella nova TaxID=334625 RepID=A0A7R9QII0_9ACAR|nr:unnamed protein product [Oppiella nova]CAG2166406.1 unnamed protein product [Oppiella nova]